MNDDQISINASHSRPGLDFFAGSAGGVAGVVVGHPFDTIKVRFQHPSFKGKYGSTAMAFKTIVREENVRGLYKGVLSPIAGISFVNGLVFASFKSAMQYLRPQNGLEAPLKVFFAAGCISGLVSSFINTPIELLKIRQQASFGKPPSTLKLINTIWTHEGNVRGLYRGFTACWLRDIGFGPYFFTYEVMLRFLDPGRRVWEGEDILEETEDEIARRGGRGWGAVAVAGACAGVVSWTATFPFDVIKTRVQATARRPHPTGYMGRSSDPVIWGPYRSTWSTMRNSWKTGGWKVFYAGLQPTLLRAVPVNIATFIIYESCMAVL